MSGTAVLVSSSTVINAPAVDSVVASPANASGVSEPAVTVFVVTVGLKLFPNSSDVVVLDVVLAVPETVVEPASAPLMVAPAIELVDAVCAVDTVPVVVPDTEPEDAVTVADGPPIEMDPIVVPLTVPDADGVVTEMPSLVAVPAVCPLRLPDAVVVVNDPAVT